MENNKYWMCSCEKWFIHRYDEEGVCPSCDSSCIDAPHPEPGLIRRENMYRENVIPETVNNEMSRPISEPWRFFYDPGEAESPSPVNENQDDLCGCGKPGHEDYACALYGGPVCLYCLDGSTASSLDDIIIHESCKDLY